MGTETNFYAGYGVALTTESNKTSLKLLLKAYNEDDDITWENLIFEGVDTQEFRAEFPGLVISMSGDFSGEGITESLVIALRSTYFKGSRWEPWDMCVMSLENKNAADELKQLEKLITKFKVPQKPNFLLWAVLS